MSSAGDVVDLEPAEVRAIEKREGYVSIVFSRQPAWARAVGENPRVVPLYDCELHVWGGAIERLEIELPYETDEWEIRYRGGSRRCFLPVEFREAGPVVFELGLSDAQQIVITGTSVSLHLGEQVGTFEQWLAT